MMWDHVLRRVKTLLEEDTVLAGLYGDAMRMTGTGAHAVPMLEWMLIGDSEGELWAPMVIQFDQWMTSMEKVTQSERRLRGLFHQDLPTVIGEIQMWVQYVDGENLASPNRDGYSGRAVRFRLTPLRERFAGVSSN